jgi:hypothetical protein
MEEELPQEGEKPKKIPKKTARPQGLDVGTMNLVSARNEGGKVITNKIRDAFFSLDIEAKKMLKMSDVSFMEKDDKLLIIGDAAIHTANIFGQEVKRPLHKGIISPNEIEAFEVLGLIIKELLGENVSGSDPIYYSVPAAPIDNPSQDVLYHEMIFKKIISGLGFDAYSMNEAVAICYADCAKEQFSGLCCSWGAGMVNVACVFKTIPAFTFSVARGGDWIDENVARALNGTASRMAIIKEKEFHPETGTSSLVNPIEGDFKNLRQREAISVYYKGLINYALDHIIHEFKKHQGDIELPFPIPVVVSGGTSMPRGFVEIFEKELDKRKGFPISVSEVRQAADPLMAVAKGLLVAASAHE